MTKEQINAIAMSLNFPYDHSKGEVKDLDRLVRLVERVKSEPKKPDVIVVVEHVKSEPKKQDVIVVSEKLWKPIFQEFADEIKSVS